MVGLTYKDFVFGFAYDVVTSKLSNYQSGTFELMLGYDITFGDDSGRSRF
ncbi:MAG: hypothetical protein C0596_01670 [Marinilabiliales bacterium]|nr:MAG: hypothetical protein C0596_01670 [Marinilabiliales bacterium]